MKTYILLISLVGLVLCSCGQATQSTPDARLNEYIQSNDNNISTMFSTYDYNEASRLQPALTGKEINTVDALVNNIPQEVVEEFDSLYTRWIQCWSQQVAGVLGSEMDENALICTGQEYEDLIAFCNQQDERVLLLFYQLASRAEYPYNRLLIYPIETIMTNFPEAQNILISTKQSLERNKPQSTSDEIMIWQLRAMLSKRFDA